MTTDKDKLKRLFNNLKLGYIEQAGGMVIKLKAGQKSVYGYPDNETTFHFDNKGRFIGVGVY